MPSLSAGGLRIKIKPVSGSWRVILPLSVDCWYEIAQLGFPTYHDALYCAKAWVPILANPKPPAIQTTVTRHQNDAASTLV